ncbi:MAG TPA: hypothetical protein VEL79_04715 [Vicinamibacterales bacterium]|nr:hypothetical protein [Vicinamibacterales bacterium]
MPVRATLSERRAQHAAPFGRRAAVAQHARSGGRTWWAHFEFTRINIEPIIRRKKIEEIRRSREQQDFAPCTSFNRDVSLARLS